MSVGVHTRAESLRKLAERPINPAHAYLCRLPRQQCMHRLSLLRLVPSLCFAALVIIDELDDSLSQYHGCPKLTLYILSRCPLQRE